MEKGLAKKEYEKFPYLSYTSYYKAFPSFIGVGRLEYLIKDWKYICCELSGQLQKKKRKRKAMPDAYNSSYLWFPFSVNGSVELKILFCW